MNRFGDVVERCPYLNPHTKSHVLMTHTLDGMKSFHMDHIFTSANHGRVIGNPYAQQFFPYVKNDTLYGAITVIFVKRGDDIFSVWVKDRSKIHLTNCGGMRDKADPSNKHTSLRECQEELKLQLQDVTSIGYFTNDNKYACLDFHWHTECFDVCVDVIDDNLESEEIEYVKLLNVKDIMNLEHYDPASGISRSDTLSMYDPIHFNVMLHSARERGFIDDEVFTAKWNHKTLATFLFCKVVQWEKQSLLNALAE